MSRGSSPGVKAKTGPYALSSGLHGLRKRRLDRTAPHVGTGQVLFACIVSVWVDLKCIRCAPVPHIP